MSTRRTKTGATVRGGIVFTMVISLLFTVLLGSALAVDLQDPKFQTINVSPSASSPGSVISVTVTATDDVGLSSGVVGFESPATGIVRYVFLDYAGGNLTGSFTVDRYDPPGVWKPVYIEILDTSSNIFAATGDEVDLSAGNITISNPSPDITAPTFASLSIPNTQTNPGGKVSLSIKAADSESGLASAQVLWSNAWNSLQAFLLYNPKTGQLEADLYVPIDQSTGTYTLSMISVLDQQGNEYLWTSDSGPTMPGKDLVLGTSSKAPVAGFKDVYPGDWFAPELLFLVEYEVLGGYSDGTFKPKNNVTRAEFAKMVCQASEWSLTRPATGSFTDVDSGHWAYDYIETAKAHGVIGGYPGGIFKPGANITRAEICKMLVAAGGISLDSSGTNFGDVETSHWARAYIMTARNYDFVRGYPGNLFMPDSFATRAEAAKMIYNAYEYLGTQ
ncbi:MAG: S-layer homology domain-containing protein [Candidatus Aquicultor sp.]|nr:S-layer homology domain-containing protein [Candidatus Aquicultor sp.]